jgi:hypothetical protein
VTKISVLVPFGAAPDAAGKHRTEVWRWCSKQWDAMRNRGLVDEIVVGHDLLFGRYPMRGVFAAPAAGADQRHVFSVARALNDAAERATGDHFLLFGADHVPDARAIEWACHALRGYSYARIYDRVAYATEAATRLILHGTVLPLEAADWHVHPAPCPGVLGVRRAAFEAAGGLDERYEGWGYEDTAFLDTLARTAAGGVRGTLGPSGYVLRELWHDPGGRDLEGRNAALYREGQR